MDVLTVYVIHPAHEPASQVREERDLVADGGSALLFRPAQRGCDGAYQRQSDLPAVRVAGDVHMKASN
jgi:hypothetical protein